ncbi:hypothetical protein HUJ04_008268 [Dendroctonus ponderosae]|nr:hypothetical protein HUJ04_008268 [Dendroctonus ponderosae]
MTSHKVSHKGLQVLKYAKENGIVLFCCPAHCTHRLQPLDVGIFGPLQTYYDQDIELWLTQNPGRTVTDFEIYGLLDNVFSQGATLANSVNAFAKTCIVPFKPNVFEDWMFAPSLTTDQLMSQEGEENEQDLSQDHIAGETGEALKKDSTKEDNAHQNDKIQLPEVVNCELLPWKILKIALKLYPRFPLLLLDHKILGSANEARLD